MPKAHQLGGGREWDYLEDLAAAYAESGDFARAIESQAKAIELAPENINGMREMRSRLELYKQRKPYHRSP